MMVTIALLAAAFALAFALFCPEPTPQAARARSARTHKHWTDEAGERRCTMFGKPWNCRRVGRG